MISKQTALEVLERCNGNKRAAARELGIPKTTFWNLVRDTNRQESLIVDQSAENAHIVSVSAKVKTVDDAIVKAEVDLSIWVVDRVQVNSWEVGTKNADSSVTVTPLWQVKVWLKRQVPLIIEKAGESLLKRMREYAPKYTLPARESTLGDAHLLLVDLRDAHIGKKAWARETGQNQDLNSIKDTFALAVNACLDKVHGYNIEKIVFPIGNDFLHINNPQATTARGTPQDVDDRLSKIFEIGCLALIQAIDRCLSVAPVELLFVPGNHDLNTSWFLIQFLNAWYRNCRDVTVDTSPKQRKFFLYGPTLIGLTHGSEESHRDLPMIMAGEVPDLWAASKYREWMLGHFHKKKQMQFVGTDTYTGVIVRILCSLSATDRWHYSKGYINPNRVAEAFLYSLIDGPVGSFCANVGEL